MQMDNCTFVKVTGSGNPAVKYGIEITGAQMGINFQALSTDFEVDHLNVHHTGCVGIVAKTDPTCESNTWRGNFTMKNTIFHDNLLTNTGCEGFYIGNSHYDSGVGKTCNGTSLTVKEHDVVNVQVYNNTLQNIGNDGIQIGSAVSGCVVHHNTVTNYGSLNNYGHTNGFQAGGGTTGAKVYDNIIDTGNGYCFWDSGGGGMYYNNIARNGLLGGFSMIDYAGAYAPTGFLIANNTLVNCKDMAVIMYSEGPPTSRIVNNIFVTNQSTYAYVKYNSPTAQARTVDSNNLKTNVIGNVKFADAAAMDYHLLAGSPAIDAGTDMKSYGVTVDKDDNARSATFDIGAYEFKSTGNVAPVANAGADKSLTSPPSTIAITGTASDPDGTISAYAWTKVSGGTATMTNATTATVTLSGLVAGTYVFRFTVTDNAGATASDDVTVTVTANNPPTVSAGADKTFGVPPSSGTITGTATDADGSIASYAWTKVSGGAATMTNGNTATLSLSNLVAGTYVFRLTVTDNGGATASDDMTLTVLANVVPVVNAGADKSITTSSVVLSGTATDADGSIASYAWTKVSGGAATLTNANTATVNLTGLVTGTYVFRLTATDNSGAAVSDDVTVTAAIPNVLPTASAGADVALTAPANTTPLAGTAADVDGTITSYAWTKVSGGTATLTNASAQTASVTGLSTGTYSFRLTVTDNGGATASDDVTVTVSNNVTGRFNFTPTAANVSGWVDLVGAPHASVISATDPASGIMVSSVSTTQWSPVNYGSLTTSYNGGVTNGTVQPSKVVSTNWFCYNAAYGATVNGVVQGDNLKVSKLDPTHEYTLQMGASRASGNGTADQYGTFEYRVNGTNIKTLMVTNNASTQVEYTNIKPNAQGEIGLSARKVSGSAMNFGYIGWLVVIDLTQARATGVAVRMATETAPETNTFTEAESAPVEEGVAATDNFVFLNQQYPAGYEYAVVIFDGDGNRVYQGKWNEEMYAQIFTPGNLYIYHVLQNGRKIDTGKTAVIQ
ncbi:right-handed parallel beta-helix repeat-containing protein [Chryseolinea lacunae]|uniref:PKD domain-containing protein n=1 Tax=Chryseolinea lacunae TaxID=2801331 RepID=A0ABS1KNW7_9BACT|nr:right-handed parallel beta-helix repeat-containing protein [Chryseolinea lacunae]MBL0740923.1 PKD domain-containing protein [Chryseolinea lacunae]